MNRIRQPVTHVVLMDGTFASLADGRRSSVGRIHRLLSGQLGPLPPGRIRIHYGIGQPWEKWRTVPELMAGRWIEARIIDAYGWLASGYVPGDQVFLIGYSRGAFGVRSLAGMIGRVGLLRAQSATERNIRLAWRHYRQGATDRAAAGFRRRCHEAPRIRMVGCFDTVMALGLRLPFLWMLTEPRFNFHDAHLGADVDYGFQALALDETRAVFAPLIWDGSGGAGHIEQRWFRGVHADIGGQLSGMEFSRPLANIPLVWMLDRAESVGLPLPDGWRDHFVQDVTAPSLGSWRQWGKLFLARAPRTAGQFASESLHVSVPLPYAGPAILTGALAGDAAPRRRLRRRQVTTPPTSAEPQSGIGPVGDGNAGLS